MQTRTYKTTATIDLQLDIYGAETNDKTPKPVIVWIHGAPSSWAPALESTRRT